MVRTTNSITRQQKDSSMFGACQHGFGRNGIEFRPDLLHIIKRTGRAMSCRFFTSRGNPRIKPPLSCLAKPSGNPTSASRCLVGFLFWGNPRIKPPLQLPIPVRSIELFSSIEIFKSLNLPETQLVRDFEIKFTSRRTSYARCDRVPKSVSTVKLAAGSMYFVIAGTMALMRDCQD
jgi:hypothetical protein